MSYKLFTGCITLFVLFILLSCSDKNPVNDDTNIDTVVEDTTTLGIPANVRIDSVAIIDTVYYYEYHEMIIDSISPTVFDTTIIITKIERDSILGSFVVNWDSVPGATRYFIYVHKNTGDLVWILKTNLTRMFVGGLVPNNSYLISIAATNENVVSKKTAYTGIGIYLPAPPKNLTSSYFNKTAKVTWDPYVNSSMIGYRIFLRDMNGIIVDSTDTLSPSTGSCSFPVKENSVYKVNGITIDSIGVSLICSTYIYDITTDSDTAFRLPYVYLSAYEKPPPVSGGYADSMVGVKGGIFAMGNIWGDTNMTNSSASQPVHEVVVSSFYLAKHEITIEEYMMFLTEKISTNLINVLIDTIFHYDTIADTTFDTTSHFDTTIINDSTIIEFVIDTITVDTIEVTINTVMDNASMVFLADNDTLLKDPFFIRTNSTLDTIIIDSGKGNFPINGVNWKGAVSYCNWLSDREGLQPCYNPADDWSYDSAANGYRLPTEAEFEYVHSAAFLGTKQRYPWGYTPDVTKYCSDTLVGPCNTGSYGKYFGFYDLSGNIMEWCNDRSDFPNSGFSSYYAECLTSGICVNPSGPSSGDYHILRGGSYKRFPDLNTSAYRHIFPGTNVSDYGFRVARSEK